MEKLNQQYLSDLNDSLRFIQDSFDDAIGSTGNKEKALAVIQDKYKGGQLFKSKAITVNIKGLSLDHKGDLHIDLKFFLNNIRKLNLYSWTDFTINYYSDKFINFEYELNIKLNQLELEEIIAYRDQLARDYIQFTKNDYSFSYNGDHVGKEFAKNSLTAKYPIKDIFEQLTLEFGEVYTILEFETTLSTDIRKFQLSEGNSRSYIGLEKHSNSINIVFRGVSYKVANGIYEGLDDKVNNIIEIIKLRSQIGEIIKNTKKSLWSLFSDKNEKDPLGTIKKYKEILHIFQEMKEKGEKKESDIMISFIDDILMDADMINSYDMKRYLISINDGIISRITLYYHDKIKKCLYGDKSDVSEELKKISVVCKKVYNNYPDQAEYLERDIIDIVGDYILNNGIDDINQNYLDILSNIFGKEKFYSILLGFFIQNDISYIKNDNIGLIDLTKYDLFFSDMWNNSNIPYFSHQVFIPYITQLLLDDISHNDLESYQNLNIEKIIAKYKLDYKFIDYINDYLVSKLKFEEIYQTVLAKFLKEDMSITEKGQLPDLTKYNVEFNIDNDNILDSSKDMFIYLIKDIIVFSLKSNPSILEDVGQYNLVSLLKLLGYELELPFMIYIKYQAKLEDKDSFWYISEKLYFHWMEEDENNMDNEIYFEKYIHVLNEGNEEEFTQKVLFPYLQKKINEDNNILENLDDGTLENIVKTCNIEGEGFNNYIKFNLNDKIKFNIIEALILSTSKDLIKKDRQNIKNNKTVDFWKYELFFTTDNFAKSIQEFFLEDILIPTLKSELKENVQTLDNKESVTLSDLLIGLGYGNFSFTSYIDENISSEDQEKYLNDIGSDILDTIVSEHRYSGVKKKVNIIKKYKKLWLLLSVKTKENFVDYFLDNTLSSHIDRGINTIVEEKLSNLDSLLEEYEIYRYYMKDEYIKKYTDKLKKKFSKTHINQLGELHQTMLKKIKKGEEINLENTIQDYKKYIGVPLEELEKRIEELENNYNSVFKQGENKLGVSYAKVYEKGQFTRENLKDLLDKYREYIDKYFVKNDVSSEEKVMLKRMMFTICIYYFVVGDYDFQDLIDFAKENSNYDGYYSNIYRFLEDINNLKTSGMKKDMNYLLIMIQIYEKTFNKISLSSTPSIEKITVNRGGLDIELENPDSKHQGGSLCNIVEVLFLHELDDIYSSLTKTPYSPPVGTALEKVMKSSLKQLEETLSNDLSYEQMKFFRNRLSSSVTSKNMSFMPKDSPLVLTYKYVY